MSGSTLNAVFKILEDRERLLGRAREILREVQPEIVGKHIKFGAYIYRVVSAHISVNEHVTMTGVRINGHDSGPRQQYHCGILRSSTEFVDV